jgi:hypothetical protein
MPSKVGGIVIGFVLSADHQSGRRSVGEDMRVKARFHFPATTIKGADLLEQRAFAGFGTNGLAFIDATLRLGWLNDTRRCQVHQKQEQ